MRVASSGDDRVNATPISATLLPRTGTGEAQQGLDDRFFIDSKPRFRLRAAVEEPLSDAVAFCP
jgi:hypothetical protein